MKVLLLNGSPRAHGNTDIALREMVRVFEQEGVETELIQVGNHPYTEITNNYKFIEGNDKKLLVIKDSFAHSLVPFLTDHYSKIVMVDLRYYKSSVSELIENEKFTDILFLYSIDNLATDTDLAWLE